MADTPPPPHDPSVPLPFPWKPSRASGHGRKVLGRGLGAIIPGADLPTPAATGGVTEIPIEQVRATNLQPRTSLDRDSLEELTASIRAHGVLQPVIVRPASDGMYELIAGERRWRAAVASGLKTVPAIVRDMDDRGALEVALVENLQREDLNPVERARAYRRLLTDFGLTQDEVARRVGRSQSSVANTLRLLSLPGEVLASLESGRITEGHARALLTIEDKQRLLSVWQRVETKGMSVRATEAAARQARISREIRPRRGITIDINIIQQELSSSLGAPVRIVAKAKGGGEIRVSFFDHDDLDRLIALLTREQRHRR